MEEELKKLVNISSTKYSTTFYSESNKSDFYIDFNFPIELDNNLNYELGLLWFSTYNTIYNITNENNKYTITDSKGTTTKQITPGAYKTILSLNDVLKPEIEITVDEPTSKCRMNIKTGYSLKFLDKSFFHNMLGFSVKGGLGEALYKEGKHLSEDIVRITNINSINIYVDCVKGSYINGCSSNIVYSFPSFTVPSGYKLFERQIFPIYYPINRKHLNKIRIKILDDQDKIIDFNGEKIIICLHLKQV